MKTFKRDQAQTDLLIKAGKRSAAEGIRASRALGLTFTYIQKNNIVAESPDGTKTIIDKKDAKIEPAIQLKKGMVFYAKK